MKKSDLLTGALQQKTLMTFEKEFNAQGLFVNVSRISEVATHIL